MREKKKKKNTAVAYRKCTSSQLHLQTCDMQEYRLQPASPKVRSSKGPLVRKWNKVH